MKFWEDVYCWHEHVHVKDLSASDGWEWQDPFQLRLRDYKGQVWMFVVETHSANNLVISASGRGFLSADILLKRRERSHACSLGSGGKKQRVASSQLPLGITEGLCNWLYLVWYLWVCFLIAPLNKLFYESIYIFVGHITSGAQHGAQTHDPEIKSLIFYWLS